MRRRPLLTICLVALAIRLIHLWQIRPSPWFDVLMGDARGYDAWAQRIAGGEWLGTEVFYQAPLYPYCLGALYALFGRDLLIVRLVQALLGALAAVLLGRSAARLVSPRAGLIAGLGYALYAPAIFFDGLLQKATLDGFLMCLVIERISAIAVRADARWTAWLGLGAAMGAARAQPRERAGADRRGGDLGRHQARLAFGSAGLRDRAGRHPRPGRRAQRDGRRRVLPHHLAVRAESLHRQQPAGGRHLHVAAPGPRRPRVRAAGRDRAGRAGPEADADAGRGVVGTGPIARWRSSAPGRAPGSR